MPSPKSGSPCTLVSPAAPRSALDADVADPGAVDQSAAQQSQSGTGKYGSTPVTPFKPGAGAGGPGDPAKTGWIEIVLLDDARQPVAGESYAITLPDGSVATGTTDEKGLARVEGFDPGPCQVTFPDLDGAAWKPA